MGIDPMCAVQIGTHEKPYWHDKASGMIVCDRHKTQYEERGEEFGPFNWEEIDIRNVFNEE